MSAKSAATRPKPPSLAMARHPCPTVQPHVAVFGARPIPSHDTGAAHARGECRLRRAVRYVLKGVPAASYQLCSKLHGLATDEPASARANAGLGGPVGATQGACSRAPGYLKSRPPADALTWKRLKCWVLNRCRMAAWRASAGMHTDKGNACPALDNTPHILLKTGRLHWFDSTTGQRLL